MKHPSSLHDFRLRFVTGLLATTMPFVVTPEVAHARDSAFGPSHGTVERIDAPDTETRRADGVYGRFNGDLSLAIGAGVEGDLEEDAIRPLIVGQLTFYQTVGLYSSYREGVQRRDSVERMFSLGLELSPLFLFRWSRAWEKGPAFWDLTLDSLAFYGGAALIQDQPEHSPLEVAPELGLGLSLPLMGRANGLWLRSQAQLTLDHDPTPSVFLWLSWQGFVHTGILEIEEP